MARISVPSVKAAGGFVTVKILDEDEAEVVDVEVECVRLLRVDDGQDE